MKQQKDGKEAAQLFLGPENCQIQACLCGFGHPVEADELLFSMEIYAACKNIRRWEALKAELRTIRTASNR